MADEEYIPRLYFEARIDFTDVRSGFRDTCSVSKALEIQPLEDDSLWTQDMVWDIDPSVIESGTPPSDKLRSVPDFVYSDLLPKMEALVLSYMLRYSEVRVFRNFALNLYSGPGESLDDFRSRCLDMLSESFRKELDHLHEVFGRKMEQVRQKYLQGSGAPVSEKDFGIVKIYTHHKSKMHEMSERITDLFLQTQLTLDTDREAPGYASLAGMELDQRLASLDVEVQQEIHRLLNQYQERVRNIDEYVIHPNLKDIHLVRICILWMPGEVRS